MDKHRRRTRPARYHDNRRRGFEADDWNLKEIRERIRGRDRRDDDDTEEVHDDGR